MPQAFSSLIGFFAILEAFLSPLIEYKYVEDTTRIVSLIQHATFMVGTLDKYGTFQPAHRFPYNGFLHTGMNNGPLMNGSERPGQPVYEYRSGVLVPGELSATGRFVPKVGGEIIAFTTYRYHRAAPRIRNLPGDFRLQPVGEAAKP